MPPASPSRRSKPSMMLERWQRTGLVPPQQPPLIMKAKGSPPASAAARTRASSRRARGVVLVAEPEHARHGAEDLLLRDLHLVVDLGEDRGLVVEPVGERGILGLPAAAAEPGTLLLADPDVPLDLAELLLRDERAHPGREVHGIAHLDLLRSPDEALDEP